MKTLCVLRIYLSVVIAGAIFLVPVFIHRNTSPWVSLGVNILALILILLPIRDRIRYQSTLSNPSSEE